MYLDDIVVFSRTYEEHIEKLQVIFQRLKDAGLKLKTSKCKLFQKAIKYLGHLVTENGVATDPDKVKCVQELPVPKCVKDIQSFVGFTGYKDFSKIARPLHELTHFKTRGNAKKRKYKPFKWEKAHQSAFETLKKLVTSSPTLAFADFKNPFILHKDASSIRLGAALYQIQDGEERFIAFASRGLSQSERNYPAKLEFLALKWAVSEKFHDSLYGNQFLVRTDNNPYTYILT